MKVKKGLTYADITEEVQKKQKKYQDIISDPNSTELMRHTAQLNLDKVNTFADEVFQSMEANKPQKINESMPMAAFGMNVQSPGKNKTYPYNSGLLIYNDDGTYKYKGKTYKRKYPKNKDYRTWWYTDGPGKTQGLGYYNNEDTAVIYYDNKYNNPQKREHEIKNKEYEARLANIEKQKKEERFNKYISKYKFNPNQYITERDFNPNIDPEDPGINEIPPIKNTSNDFPQRQISTPIDINIVASRDNNIGNDQIQLANTIPFKQGDGDIQRRRQLSMPGGIPTQVNRIPFNPDYGDVPRQKNITQLAQLNEESPLVNIKRRGYQTEGYNPELRGTYSPEITQNNSIGIDDVAPYIIPAINIGRGIFGKADEVDSSKYMVNRRVRPLKMDINPQLRDVEGETAIARRNVRNMSPTQTMSGNIAAADWATKARQDIYSNKFNVEQQGRMQSEMAGLEQENRNKAMDLQIYDMNLRNKAAKENMLSSGMSQAMEAYWRNRGDKMTQKELDAQIDMFNEGLNLSKEQFEALRTDRNKQFNDKLQLEYDMMNYNLPYAIETDTEGGYNTNSETNVGSIGGTGGGNPPPNQVKATYTAPDYSHWAFGLNSPVAGPMPSTLNEEDKKIYDATKHFYMTHPDDVFKYVDKHLIKAESAGNPFAISEAGALGLYQFMPATAQDMGLRVPYKLVQLDLKGDRAALARETNAMYASGQLTKQNDERLDPVKLREAAKNYYHKLFRYYDGDVNKALAAYNWGMGNVDEVIRLHGKKWRKHLPTETKNYVSGITSDMSSDINWKPIAAGALGYGVAEYYAKGNIAKGVTQPIRQLWNWRKAPQYPKGEGTSSTLRQPMTGARGSSPAVETGPKLLGPKQTGWTRVKQPIITEPPVPAKPPVIKGYLPGEVSISPADATTNKPVDATSYSYKISNQKVVLYDKNGIKAGEIRLPRPGSKLSTFKKEFKIIEYPNPKSESAKNVRIAKNVRPNRTGYTSPKGFGRTGYKGTFKTFIPIIDAVIMYFQNERAINDLKRMGYTDEDIKNIDKLNGELIIPEMQ